MPRIYILIAKFDKSVRAWPVSVELPGGTRTRWLTKDEARRLLSPDVSPAELPRLLFQAIVDGYQADWTAAYNLFSQSLVPLETGDLPPIRIDLEIADLEFNELPWETANFGPNCRVVRYSTISVGLATPFQLPVEALVIEGRTPKAVPPATPAFSLDEALRSTFGSSADIDAVFRITHLAGADDAGFSAIISSRRFDIVQLSTGGQWHTISSELGSEGMLRIGDAAPSLNATSLSSLFASSGTRLLILLIPDAAVAESLPPILDLASRLRSSGGPAILIVQPSSLSSGFLTSIYDAIVHDLPLDVAVARAGRAFALPNAMMSLGPGDEELLRISPLADKARQMLDEQREKLLSLKARLQAAPPPPIGFSDLLPNVQIGFAEIDRAQNILSNISTWVHESGGILPLREALAGAEAAAEIHKSTASQLEEADRSTQRVVNTCFELQGQPVKTTESLIAGAKYTFVLDVGSSSPFSNVVNPTPVPERYLEPFYDQNTVNLRVCLFSEQFSINNDSAILTLPRFGPSAPVAFEVQAPLKLGSARLRTGLYLNQNLLQSILVTAQITPAAQVLDKGNYAEVEFSLCDSLQVAPNLPERQLNVLLNETPDGTHTFAVLGENIKKQFSIKTGNEAELARQELLEICSAPDKRGNPEYLYSDDDNSGDEAKLISDLKRLAYWGWKLYCRFIMEPLDDDFETRVETVLKNPCKIQVASTTSAQYVFPWSIVYDKRLVSSPKNIVCPNALNILKAGGPPGHIENIACPGNGCASAEDVNVICPFRFWGFKHSIEQPPNWGGVFTEISINNEPKCCIGAHSGLSGNQHRKEIEKTCNIVTDYHEAKDEIGQNLATSAPHLVYFYCHGGRTKAASWLGVGNDEHIEDSDFKAWNVRWRETRPLVIINGCHTVDLSPDDLLPFVTVFGWSRASGVIGTEIAIPVSLAREFGREFLQRFLSGKTVNDAMRGIRLRLLEKYNLLGLAYTPYCYGELHVTRVPS